MSNLLEKLEYELKKLAKVAICYSGGIDSSFLLFYANKVLGRDNVLAIIANGQMVARDDYIDAVEFAKENKFDLIELPYNAFEVEDFKNNTKNRCYSCKKNLMNKIKEEANKHGYINVLDGKNVDDTKVFRPGNKATQELGIISPLENSGFTKSDIRQYSKQLGIRFWNKPSNSCLATRFPYNKTLTEKLLENVEKAEEFLKNEFHINRVRVRVHENIARIEVEEKDFNIIINNNKKINENFKKIGFEFVTLDLLGIRSGAFDEK